MFLNTQICRVLSFFKHYTVLITKTRGSKCRKRTVFTPKMGALAEIGRVNAANFQDHPNVSSYCQPQWIGSREKLHENTILKGEIDGFLS